MRSNCLFFCLALYRRRARRGDAGYIVVRRSRHGPFPHFLYLHRGRRLVSFCPLRPTRRLIPPPLFAGKVKWGD